LDADPRRLARGPQQIHGVAVQHLGHMNVGGMRVVKVCQPPISISPIISVSLNFWRSNNGNDGSIGCRRCR
jgi:hypothetical protein